MDQQSGSDVRAGEACFYGIRLLITHPTMSVSEVASALGLEPDYSWNPGDREFTDRMMWGRTSWTKGNRWFFNEVHDILEWLEEKQEFVLHLLASGGDLQVIVQLSGTVNVGDGLKPETMALAMKLGVVLGIEVFPDLQRPGWTTESVNPEA